MKIRTTRDTDAPVTKKHPIGILTHKNSAVLIFLMCSCSAFAWNFQLNQIYVSALGGFAWPYANDTNTVISPTDTEINHVTHLTSAFTWGAGISWHALSHVWLQTNFYKLSTTITGSVWDYGNPNFNEYQFSVPFTSSRMMFDVTPILFTRYRFSLYGIAGLGAAWNSVSYTETPADSGAVSLATQNNTAFSYEFGAGVNAEHIIDKLNLQIEYLWTALGSARPGNKLNDAILLKPAKFTLHNQSILFGLNLAI